jgi:hypothetical protein
MNMRPLPLFGVWLGQVLTFVACIAVAKSILFVFLLTFDSFVLAIGGFILTFLGLASRPRLQLIFVMILLPTILNTIQYWIQDNYIKADDEDAAIEQMKDTLISYEEQQSAFSEMPLKSYGSGKMTAEQEGEFTINNSDLYKGLLKNMK